MTAPERSASKGREFREGGAGVHSPCLWVVQVVAQSAAEARPTLEGLTLASHSPSWGPALRPEDLRPSPTHTRASPNRPPGPIVCTSQKKRG